MASWLDKDGVTYLWGKFKSYFSAHVQTDVPANAVFTDVKTSQILNSDNVERPLLIAHTQKNDVTPVTSNTVYRNNSIYANPSTGKITATSIGCDDVTNSTNWDGTNTSLKTAVTSLKSGLDNLTDLIKVEAYDYYYSINANSGLNLTITDFGITIPDGYTPLAILRFNSGRDDIYARNVNIQATATTVMSVYNTSSSNRTNVRAFLSIAYIKSDFVAVSS